MANSRTAVGGTTAKGRSTGNISNARASMAMALLLPSLFLGGCAVGPDYVRPTVEAPAAFKEAVEGGSWKTAAPLAADSRQPWWEVYGDPALNTLVEQANAANQNLRVAEAQYREARAASDIARAGFYPTIGASAAADRARTNTTGTSKLGNAHSVGLSASWEPDLWGSVRRSVEAGNATAEASADDLAAARLSIQASVAQDYFSLRIVDRQRALYAATTSAYTRALDLTQHQYAAGIVLRSDVALAQSQLKTAQAQGADLDAQRAQLEHALAILTGRPPAAFSLPPTPADQPFVAVLPATPAGLPSELLERRPDIASAERKAAAANAQIGVAKAAYFPSLTLSASGGFSSDRIATLFDTPARVWSIGAALAQTVFDGGLRHARTAQAEAAYDAAAAQYKQTVLAGFQSVEDQLATLRVLDGEAKLQNEAVQASQLAEQLALTQYRAGSATYLSVVTAQTLSLTNQRTAVQLQGRQLAASVGLITATGGGWRTSSAADDQVAATSSTRKPTP